MCAKLICTFHVHRLTLAADRSTNQWKMSRMNDTFTLIWHLSRLPIWIWVWSEPQAVCRLTTLGDLDCQRAAQPLASLPASQSQSRCWVVRIYVSIVRYISAFGILVVVVYRGNGQSENWWVLQSNDSLGQLSKLTKKIGCRNCEMLLIGKWRECTKVLLLEFTEY